MKTMVLFKLYEIGVALFSGLTSLTVLTLDPVGQFESKLREI